MSAKIKEQRAKYRVFFFRLLARLASYTTCNFTLLNGAGRFECCFWHHVHLPVFAKTILNLEIINSVAGRAERGHSDNVFSLVSSKHRLEKKPELPKSSFECASIARTIKP